NAGVLRHECGRRILHVKEPLAKGPELSERRHGARQHDAVTHERRFADVNSRRLEHRLELLTHGVIWSSDERRLAIVRLEQLLCFAESPTRGPACNEPSRM